MAPTLPTQKKLIAAICLALAVWTIAIYLPVLRDGFINFDDDAYITGNPHIQGGLTWSAITWAFKSGYAANWHPLTWISHMLDYQMFGLNPAGHHLVNVLFHAANTVLLFLLINMMTGAIWRSAFVAALFALHPLHVESVAWASERKDVLSGFFWMLTLIAYARYVRAPAPRERTTPYILALLLFACGLMSKPTVVTLPFVLLLLDFWPLYRFNISTLRSVIVEKIPFFLLSFAGCVMTYAVQKNGGAVTDNSLSFRIENALWAYERYLTKIFCPTNLSIVYPFQNQGLFPKAIVAALLLMICSAAFIFLSGQRRYFFTGWFWFLGTLVPTIGIVQVGSASMADRYTYLPGIGLFILVTWSIADFFASRQEKMIPALLAVIALAGCAIMTSIQITYWRNNVTLFNHALQVTSNNYIACACLGSALDAIGEEQEALTFCRAAVKINPDYPAGQFFLSQILWKMGQTAQAAEHLDAAAKNASHNAVFQYNLGKFLLEHNSPDKAAERFQAALNDDPTFPEAHYALGIARVEEGQLQKATDELSQAVALQPNFLSAQQNLAVALASQGKLNDAIPHFSKIVELQPDNPDSYFNLGFAYLNNHQPADAAAQFTRELKLTPNETKAHYRLAQALEQQNQLSEAVSQYRQTLQLTPHFPEAQKTLDEILAAHPELR